MCLFAYSFSRQLGAELEKRSRVVSTIPSAIIWQHQAAVYNITTYLALKRRTCWIFVTRLCMALTTASPPPWSSSVVNPSSHGALPFFILFIASLTSSCKNCGICSSALFMGKCVRTAESLCVSTLSSCSKCSFHRFCMLASSDSRLPFRSLIDVILSSNFPLSLHEIDTKQNETVCCKCTWRRKSRVQARKKHNWDGLHNETDTEKTYNTSRKSSLTS